MKYAENDLFFQIPKNEKIAIEITEKHDTRA